jgi:hypothetical protein
MDGSMTERCPWCGTLISRSKFLEVEAKIREEERKRLAEAEAGKRTQLEAKFQEDLDAAKRAAVAKATEEANKRVTSLVAERDRVAEKLKLAEAREASIRKQAQEDADQRVKKEIAAQRAILQKDLDQKLLKQQSGFARERESYTRKIQEMERTCRRKRLVSWGTARRSTSSRCYGRRSRRTGSGVFRRGSRAPTFSRRSGTRARCAAGSCSTRRIDSLGSTGT